MSIAGWIANYPDQVARAVVGERWFGDKSRTVTRVSPSLLAEFAHDGQQFGLVLVRFDFEQSEPSTYFVPWHHRSDDTFVDAVHDPSFLGWVADGFGEDRSLAIRGDGDGQIVWRPADPSAPTPWTSHPGRVLGGEQSNTSVLYGSQAIVKFFRKVQPGINPDSEIVAFLTKHHDFPNVPRFLGSITLERGGQEPVELAAVQGFVPNGGDCWRWLPGALGTSSAEDRGGLLADIELLGLRTGQLHGALADGRGDLEFEAAPFTDARLAALEARLGREVRQTTSALHRQGATSYDESEALAASLLARVSGADVLLGHPEMRVHGDYHLGQVLRTDGDFVIIDFEGEPSRPMAERRQKASPLKDVAGMLRSLDYAVAAATPSFPGPTRESEALTRWRGQAESAFVTGWRSAFTDGDIDLAPVDPERFQRALDLFMIEKALYEVRYELDNRPDWVDIPLAALRRIAATS